MVPYGTNAKILKVGQIINVNCPSCEVNTTFKYSIYGKYAYIYFIPFFPLSKITVAECNSCNKTFEYKNLPEKIKSKFQREKEIHPVKYPIWIFSGLIAIPFLIVIAVFIARNIKDNEDIYIKNPLPGDVYHLKLDNGHFTTIRVDKIKKDSVYVTFNDYETDKTSGIDDIDLEENYTTNKDTYHKHYLEIQYNSESIISIDRK